jgi:hypothetical protein
VSWLIVQQVQPVAKSLGGLELFLYTLGHQGDLRVGILKSKSSLEKQCGQTGQALTLLQL